MGFMAGLAGASAGAGGASVAGAGASASTAAAGTAAGSAGAAGSGSLLSGLAGGAMEAGKIALQNTSIGQGYQAIQSALNSPNSNYELGRKTVGFLTSGEGKGKTADVQPVNSNQGAMSLSPATDQVPQAARQSMPMQNNTAEIQLRNFSDYLNDQKMR